jgi:outer membrane protein assembly factor BamB
MSFGGRRGTALWLGVPVLVVAIVIGVASWNVHRLQTSDVEWSAPAIQAETTVAAGRLYTFDDLDALTVTRLSDGKRLADLPAYDESSMYVGSSGWFATVSFRRGRLAFYSPDGTRQWERPIDKGEAALQPPHAIGDGFIVYRDCVDDECALKSVDGSGREQWTTPVERGEQVRPYAHGETVDQTEVTNPGGTYLRRAPSVAVVNRDGRLFALDDSGQPLGESIAAAESTVIRDLLIETTVSDSECTYRAVREGAEIWSTTVPCPGVSGVYTALTTPDRLYVRYFTEGDDKDTMGSVDLTDGSAHQFDFAWRAFDDETKESVTVGPDVIVRQKGESVTGIDPDTGKTRWTRTFDKHYGSYSDKDLPAYVGIDVLDGAVSVIDKHESIWRSAAIGRDLPTRYVRMLDTRTGETVTQLLQESLYSSVGLGEGKGTLVLADDQLFRLRG